MKRVITVNDKIQTGYTYTCTEPAGKNFHPDFKPDLTPQEMLALGASKPWPEALKAMTGEDKIDATAILDYFAPLKQWLDEQNKGETVGW